jgi:hypothetical protein
MTTYAAAIAARLQGREDEDMAGRTRKTDEVGDPWESMAALFDQLRDHCVTVIRERDDLKALADKTATAAANRTLTAEASGELKRVQQLEADRDRARALNLEKIQEVGTAEGERDAARMRVAELERELMGASARIAELQVALAAAERASLDEVAKLTAEFEAETADHDQCYVAREVSWTDVAAGMMTIARDGTPWMVVERVPESGAALIRNGGQQFVKCPEDGETVRVLVPYVTDEQAQGLVASELGGTEVG